MLTSDLRGQHPTMERPLHTRRMQPKAAASTGRRFRTICGVFLMFVMAEFIGGASRAFHGAPSPSRASFLTVGNGRTDSAEGRKVDGEHLYFTKHTVGFAAGATGMGAAMAVVGLVSRRDVASASQVQAKKEQSWLQHSAPVLLIPTLVLQKCSADALTWFTRAKYHMAYSGSNVTLVSEVLKFPILMVAVVIFNSRQDLWPTIRAALTESPFAMWWVGLLYAVQNLLYFACLQYTSAAAYQVMSQTKMIFTAAFMWQMLGKKFSQNQILALAMLILGTVFTQLAEIQGPMTVGSRPWFGASLAVLSALLSALPNVFYERLLKAQKNQWVSNLQLTTWICTWVAIIKGCEYCISGVHPVGNLSELFQGFTPLVWAIVALKTLNCIIIPACLKYADNILYGYAKPLSIVLTTVVTATISWQVPSPVMLTGISLVATSIVTYSRG